MSSLNGGPSGSRAGGGSGRRIGIRGGVLIVALATIVVALALATPGPASPGVPSTVVPGSAVAASSPPRPVESGPVAVLVGAGDIADCGTDHDGRTAELVEGIAGTVFTAGDNAYEGGAPTEFRDCYGPTWGRFRDRTRPAAGNHDFATRAADGYFGYFGPAAGAAGDGWYSYDAGAWHVVVLNSNCDSVGGCDAASAQGAWLAADLAAHPARCTIAIWHHPRFSSGEHGSDPRADAFWRALHAAGADVVVNGHDHDYERFAPQSPDGALDPTGGIRQFVVGTGGKGLRGFPSSAPNSEARDARTYGVLALTLRPTTYEWRFVGVPGATFTDSGVGACH